MDSTKEGALKEMIRKLIPILTRVRETVIGLGLKQHLGTKVIGTRAALAFKKDNNTRHTLSLAFQEVAPLMTKIKLWDYAWRDYENSYWRELWGPTMHESFLPFPMQEISQWPAREVDMIVKILHKGLLRLFLHTNPTGVPLVG